MTTCRSTCLLLELVEDIVYCRGEVISIDAIDTQQHRLLRQLLYLVHLELFDAQLLAALGRRLECLEQETTHDGVGDDNGGESDV